MNEREQAENERDGERPSMILYLHLGRGRLAHRRLAEERAQLNVIEQLAVGMAEVILRMRRD